MDSLQNSPNHIESSEDEFWPLSGRPYFNVVLKKSLVKRLYTLYVPVKLAKLFPPVNIPVVFTYHGKKWESFYTAVRRDGHTTRKTYIKWREFVIDNHLKEGDACVFEVIDCSYTPITIRVQILRGRTLVKFQCPGNIQVQGSLRISTWKGVYGSEIKLESLNHKGSQ